MTDAPALLYDAADGVARLTINRPQRRNALSPATIQLFGVHLDQAQGDPQVRAVCITGAGEQAFCAGADLAATVGGPGGLEAMRDYARLLLRLDAFPKPLVARVNGYCVGGGLGLMLACDMAYARAGAKLGTPELNVGLFPMMIAPLILRAAPRSRALEMIYTAAMIPAEEARELGLVTRVFPAGELDTAVDGILQRLAGKAPVAMAAGRRALAAVQGMELEPAMDHLCDQLLSLVRTEDAAEGLSAFLQRREPVWKGR